MSDGLYWIPVVHCNGLPECIVWPGSQIGDIAAAWWVANDAETATDCYLHEFSNAVSIEPKNDPG